jgi:hypothetical protein
MNDEDKKLPLDAGPVNFHELTVLWMLANIHPVVIVIEV